MIQWDTRNSIINLIHELILKQERVTHFRILLGSAFHMNGPLYANEFLKISRLAYDNVTKLVDVEFLVGLSLLACDDDYQR